VKLPHVGKGISKMNYWAARGLAEFHKQLKDRLYEVEKMIAVFLCVPEDPDSPGYFGHLSDGLWEDGTTIDDIMNRLSVELQDDRVPEPNDEG